MKREAKANVDPLRQRTQYSCMSASMCMALCALGRKCTEDEVNEVMGARPMKGATWESALACGQHFGMRCTLTTPSTITQLKSWTDAGIPVLIAWNPEDRPWSHASLVFDVDEMGTVSVADPNIPDPEETVRVVSKADFYKKWYERWPNYLVRRPAMAVEPEISPSGRQVMASTKRDLRMASVDRRKVVGRYGIEAWAAWEEYVKTMTTLEATADTVVVAAKRLTELGINPHDDRYPFGENIEAITADIHRWRSAAGLRSKEDPKNMSPVVNRVAARYLALKGRQS